MNNNYRLVVDKDEFQQKVLDYIGSDEIDKMISSTVFDGKPECKRAIIHGMAIASILTSYCTLMCVKDCENDEEKKIIDVLVTTDRGKVTKVQRIFDQYIGWHWGRILGEMRAWKPLPKPYKLNGI